MFLWFARKRPGNSRGEIVLRKLVVNTVLQMQLLKTDDGVKVANSPPRKSRLPEDAELEPQGSQGCTMRASQL